MRFPRLTAVTKAAVSAVSSIFGDTSAARAPRGLRGWGMLHEPYTGAWQRGVEVDPIGGLTANGAVYACLDLISKDIGKLTPLLLEKTAAGIKVPADSAAPDWRALRKPNAYQTRNQFFRQWMLSKLMHGNAYALKVRENVRGKVTGLHLLDPRRVTPMVTPDGSVYYSLGGDDLAQVPGGGVVPASEIIHDRCCTLWHPLIGVPPLYAASMSATQARRIQGNSALFFENMSRPSGFIKVPTELKEAQAAELKKSWEQNYSGQNVGRLAVLTGGMTYEAMGIPAEQAQLIEQLKWTAIDIAGVFLVPAYKIGAGVMPTTNNVEAQQQQYYDGCLQSHIEDIEVLLTEGLEVAPGKLVEFDLKGLLRMDTAAQVEVLTKAAGGAFMKVDEARGEMNLPPVTGGDTIYKQHQDYSIAALAKRDASDDPFGTSKPAPAPTPTPPAVDDPPEDEGEKSARIAQVAIEQVTKAHDAARAELLRLADERRLAEVEAAKARAAAEEEKRLAAEATAAEAERARVEAEERAEAEKAAALKAAEEHAAALAEAQRKADEERLAAEAEAVKQAEAAEQMRALLERITALEQRTAPAQDDDFAQCMKALAETEIELA
jgi:HK97 family phage portal protein